MPHKIIKSLEIGVRSRNEPHCPESVQHLFPFRINMHLKQSLFQGVDLYLFKPFADCKCVIRKPFTSWSLVDYIYERIEYLVLLAISFDYRVFCSANLGLMAQYRADCSLVTADPDN